MFGLLSVRPIGGLHVLKSWPMLSQLFYIDMPKWHLLECCKNNSSLSYVNDIKFHI
jgi:hypothetical protein